MRPRSLLLLLTAGLVACSGSGGAGGSGGSPRPSTRPTARPVSWTARLHAVMAPQAVTGGFALQGMSTRKTFQVVSVAAATGRVRWAADASPSLIAPGVAQETLVANGGRTVVWLAPAGDPADGTVSVTAADAVTGRVAWTYGGGEYETGSPPTVCHGGDQICLVGAPASTGTLAVTALDARTGAVVATTPVPGGRNARDLGPDIPGRGPSPDTIGLLDTVGSLTGVDYDGRVLWQRADSAVFGGQPVSPDQGWSIGRLGGDFVGTLGDTRFAPSGTRFTADRQPAAAAVFDIRTGRTVWSRPATSFLCGALPFDPAHPVVCTGGFTIDESGTTAKVVSADITLEGIDLATGRARWTWHAGDEPGLVEPSGDMLQVDDTHVTFHTGGRVVTVDLDHGPTAAVERTGWCASDRYVATAYTAYRANGQTPSYRATGTRPCAVDGTTPATPPSTPDFAGATEGGAFAWTDDAGTVHAVPAR